MRYLSCFLVIVTCTSITASCGTDAGPEVLDNPQGSFDQNSTFQLRVHDGLLYAGTEDGLFRKPVDPAATEWESLGLGDATNRTFLVFSEQEILTSASYENPEKNTIAKTIDGGQQWVQFRNGFGGDLEITPLILKRHPTNKDVLYGRALFNVAKSTDRGRNWESKFLEWDFIGAARFITIDQNNPENVWAGGSTPSFFVHLVKTNNGGETWERVPPSGTQTDVYDLVVKPNESKTVLAGMGIGIYRSTDDGKTWDPVFEQAAVFAMEHSARNPQTIYASGINQANTLFFARSTDFGDTWQLVDVAGAPTGIFVNDMASVMVGDSEVLYFATTKGVYSYTFEE